LSDNLLDAGFQFKVSTQLQQAQSEFLAETSSVTSKETVLRQLICARLGDFRRFVPFGGCL
jgi:hypothetical protein